MNDVRCPRCREEVMLARSCPYCGAVVGEQADGDVPAQDGLADDDPAAGEGFRGPLRAESGTKAEGAAGPRRMGPFALVTGTVRYLFDPKVPLIRKFLIAGALAYLISPLDIVPDLLPVLGWLDDAAVAVALWAFITGEIGRYTGRA